MKIIVLQVGNTNEDFIKNGISIYLNRLTHYINISIQTIPDLKDRKSLPIHQIKEDESSRLIQNFPKNSFKILLDEKGKLFSSLEFAGLLQKQFNQGTKELLFIIGGAFGVSESLKAKVDLTLSLSPMTFTHQMVRLFAIEQIYRAMTIIKNEPYHNV